MKKKILLLLIASGCMLPIYAQYWSLTGNSISSGNFLGTTNFQNLIFKANNQISGRIDVTTSENTSFGYNAFASNSSGAQTVSIGYQSLQLNSTGTQNVAVGYNTLQTNSSGSYNCAFGTSALQANTANYNSAFGQQALNHNTSGTLNTGIGSGSLYTNTTGQSNSALGVNSLFSNTSGSYNTATGMTALYSNTASYNTANGYGALHDNTIGNENTATGYEALYKNTSAGRNTAFGYLALYSNNSDSGYDNTAVGETALYSNTSGYQNVAVGGDALYSNTTGAENTVIGRDALSNNSSGNGNTANGLGALAYNTTGNNNVGIGNLAFDNNASYTGNTTGSCNTGIGYLTLSHNITGSMLTAIGCNTDVNSSNYTNVTLLGNGAIGTSSNQIRIGNSSVTSIGGYANWTNISDGRVKKNIKENVPGLIFINRLVPVTYNLDLEAADKILKTGPLKDKNGNIVQPSQEVLNARKQKESVIYTGFVAQDVEKAAKSINYKFSGVDSAKNSNDLYGLRYADFVVPLVKAVQELSAKNDSLADENKKIESEYIQLSKKVDSIELQLKNNNTSSVFRHSKDQSVTINQLGSLQQNAPNPFSKSTSIYYNIPANSNNAKIEVTNMNGSVLKEIPITSKGSGEVTISAGTLSSGNYIYTLYVDNQKIESKQMILTK